MPVQGPGIPRYFFGSQMLKKLPSLMEDRRCLIITGRRSFTDQPASQRFFSELDQRKMVYFLERQSGEPSPNQIDALVEQYRSRNIELVIAIGGGSVLDTGKAVAAMLTETDGIESFLEGVGTRSPGGSRLPFFAVPITAGTGSEATINAVVSRPGPQGFKKSLRHPNYLPDLALIDPELALSCPASVTAACGMDALTQLIEAYVSTKANSFTDALALDGLDKVASGLPAVLQNPKDVEARSAMAWGAFMSGICLAQAGLGTVHGFASSIGGLIEVPHGVICGRLLPPVTETSIRILSEENSVSPALVKYRTVAEILTGRNSTEALIEYLYHLVEISSIPLLHIEKKDYGKICANTGNKNNPCFFPLSELEKILEKTIAD